MTEKSRNKSSAPGARVPSAAQSATSNASAYASSYPKVQLRGFYSEVLAPDAERRLGVSNFIIFNLTIGGSSSVEERIRL